MEYFCAYFNTSSNLIKDDSCSLSITDNIGVCDCTDKRSYKIVEEFTTRTETRQVLFEKVNPPPPTQTSTKPIDSSPAPPAATNSTNVTEIIVPIIIGFIVLVNIGCLIVLMGYCIKKRKQKVAMNTNLNIATAVELNNVE